MRLIYTVETRRCLPRYDFPASFSATFTENHWSNAERSIEFVKEIFFPYLKKVKKEKGFPEEQHRLVSMDIFKPQENDILEKLCSKSRCETMIVPHNLTSKFQSYVLTTNKATKGFIQNQYNDWCLNQIAYQLKSGKDPANIKISSKFSDLKPLHPGWIVNLHNRMQRECKTIEKGVKETGIVEAVKDSEAIHMEVEDPFSLFS